MVLVLNKNSEGSLQKQIEKILVAQKTGKKKHHWNKFFGKVKSIKDPIAYQRNLRDE
jgi:hypothetical protein